MFSSSKRLVATNLPQPSLAFTNLAYVSADTFKQLGGNDRIIKANVNGYFFSIESNSGVANGEIALNSFHRGLAKIETKKEVEVRKSKEIFPCTSVLFACQLFKDNVVYEIDDLRLESEVKSILADQVVHLNQKIAIVLDNIHVILHVICITQPGKSTTEMPDPLNEQSLPNGTVDNSTLLWFQSIKENSLKIHSKRVSQKAIFRPDFDFSKLGIGGLDKEFTEIFRRAFTSRVFPSLVEELGINHVKGMLLYGPPGTGKTLIARQIGKMLKAKEPIIINGPEVLNKYVGQSEENIRNVFKEAEKEQKEKGSRSQLHIIIFDELDAICKQRGSTANSSGVGDSIVNQLLSKIDGVNALNNILLIGMTNRKDLIDEALLRPGRLEVHIEVGLPDEEGRFQIWTIHTRAMRESKRLAYDVNLKDLAHHTKNYSGAEIEGVVRSAAAWAMSSKINANNFDENVDVRDVIVKKEHFELALNEIRPAMGIKEEDFENTAPYGLISYSEEFNTLQANFHQFTNTLLSQSTNIYSVLLYGEPQTGKTAFLTLMAQYANAPFIKIISADKYIGTSEAMKVASIAKIFDDAYKSTFSIIIIDDLEKIMEYTPIGPRFSNTILQCLQVLIKKGPPKKERKLMIYASTNYMDFIQDAGLSSCFTWKLKMPWITTAAELQQVLQQWHVVHKNLFQRDMDLITQIVKDTPLGIKTLLTALEMSSERNEDNELIPMKATDVVHNLRLCGVII